MKMYRLRSVKPKHDLFLMAKNDDELSFSLYPYVIKNGIRVMYAFKEHDLQGVDLEELPEGAYVITEYEHGQVVEVHKSHTCDYVLTSFEGHRVLKCAFCESIAPV
jgi:hypothetical protein